MRMTAKGRPASAQGTKDQRRDNGDEVADVGDEAADERQHPPGHGAGDLQDEQDEPVEQALGAPRIVVATVYRRTPVAKPLKAATMAGRWYCRWVSRAATRPPSTAIKMSMVRMITRTPTMPVMFPSKSVRNPMRRPGVNAGSTVCVCVGAESDGLQLGRSRRPAGPSGEHTAAAAQRTVRVRHEYSRRPPARRIRRRWWFRWQFPGDSPAVHPAPNRMDAQGEHERQEYRGEDPPHRGEAEGCNGRAGQGEQNGDGAGEGLDAGRIPMVPAPWSPPWFSLALFSGEEV